MDEKKGSSNVSSGLFTKTVIEKYSLENKKSQPKNILRLDNLISHFSTALIDTPEENLEKELNNWVKKFVEFLKVDRCIVNEYLENPKTMHLIIHYIVPEVDTIQAVYDYQPSEGVIEELEKGLIIRAEKIPDDLPQNYRGGIIEREKTKSTVIVPLSIGNKVIGSLSFANYRKRRKWSDDLVRGIKLVGEMIANAILRIRSHTKLLEEMERRQMLEETYSSVIRNANLGFMIIDLSGHSIINVNDEYCRMSGFNRDDLISKKTWEIDASLDPDQVRKAGDIVVEEGSVHFMSSHKRKDGSTFDVEISANLFAKGDNIVYSFVRDITDLNKAKKELEDRLKFEELNSELSAALVDIKPDYLDEELNHWIKKFVEFLKVDRGIIHELKYDEKTINVLVSYTDPNVDVSPLETILVAPNEILEEFSKGIILRAEKIPEDLPPLFYTGPIKSDNTKSIVIVPLTAGDKVIGNLTFANYGKERKWSDALVRRIKLIGETIANTIQRIKSQNDLYEEVERRKNMEERYSSILKTANVGFWISDKEQNILTVNDEYCRLSGYSRDELLSMTIPDVDFLYYSEKSKITDDIEGVGAVHHESTHKKKDGSLIDLDISSTLIKREGLLFSFMRDITEIKRSIKLQEERLEFEELVSGFSAALIDIKPDDIKEELENWLEKFVGFLGVDRGMVNEYINDQQNVQVLMQYTVSGVNLPTENMRKTPDGVICELEKGVIRAEKIPEDLPQVFRGTFVEVHKTKSLVVVPLLESKKVFGNLSFSSYKFERKWPDDLVRRIKLIGEMIGNAILRLRTHEILAKEMEHRRLMEEENTLVLENANVGFWISDLDKNILDVNNEYCRMSGYSRDELLSMKIPDIAVPTSPEEASWIIKKIEETGSFHHEATHIKKDGSSMELSVSSAVLEVKNVLFSFMMDVTELNQSRREQEERLGFEELVSEFSASLISINVDDIDDELKRWLKKFVDFLEVDRGFINEHYYEQDIIQLLINYTVPDIDDIPLVRTRENPKGLLKEFEKGLIVKAEKIPDDLPQMLQGGIIEKEKAKSILIVPLITSNEVIGNISFVSYRKERKWPDDLARRIKLIGEIIANAIQRTRSHKTLMEEVDRRRMIEEKYSSIIKDANVGFCITDREQNILEVNDEYCRMSGYSRDDILSMNISDVDISLDPERIAKIIKILEESGSIKHEATHIKKDGSLLELDVSSKPDKSGKLLLCFMRDITELNQRRREQEERLGFEELVSDFSAALINIDLDDLIDELKNWTIKFVDFLEIGRGVINEYQYDNNTIKALVSYTDPGEEASTSPHDSDLYAPDGVMNEFKRGVAIRAEKIPEDLQPVFRDWMIEKHNTKSLVIVPLTAGNQVIGNLTFASYRKERNWSDDIFRRIKLIGEIIANAILRKHAHETLIKEMERRHKLEERHSSIIKTANVGFMISDLNEKILEVNDAYCAMSGYTRGELLGMTLMQLDISQDIEKIERNKREAFEAGSFHQETSHIRKDGTVMDVLLSANVLEREGLVSCFIGDVSELNKTRSDLEERLEFEELVSEFSAALMNIKIDDIYEELKKWIERFVGFLEVDRGVINEHEYDINTVKTLVAYTVPDIDTVPHEMSITAPSRVMNEFKKGTIIRAEKIPKDLPPQFHGWRMEQHNTKSVVMVPLIAENQIMGNLTFVSFRKERKWSDDLVRRIKLIGEIIANAVLRKRNSDALLEEMEQRKTLEERYSSILKTANVGFIISDSDQNVMAVNDEYCRMSGYSHEELINMKISDLDISEDSKKIEQEGVETILRGSLKHESKHIKKDGNIFYVEISTKFLEKDGFYFSFLMDTTELNLSRNKLEERLQFEGLVSEFSAALVNVKLEDYKKELKIWFERFTVLMDVDRCVITEYQDNFTKLRCLIAYTQPEVEAYVRPIAEIQVPTFGYHTYLARGEILKFDSANDYFPSELKKGMLEQLGDGAKSMIMLPLMAGDILLGSMSFSSIKNEKSWTQDLTRMLKLVAEIFANTLIRDKTDFELDNYRKHLENMVDERTAKLKDAQNELVVSEKMATLGKLTATVSHELRNPLGTIRSSIYSVQKRLIEKDKKVSKALDRAERNIKRCDLIIEDLLNYSRTQKLSLEQTHIDNWIDEVLGEIGSPDGIVLERQLRSGATINFDRERFRRSFINILNNAYQAIQEKNGVESGCVRVETYRSENSITIDISDNGVGFEMDNLRKIYEPLYSTKTFGVGLGIPITRQIIEQHGWNIEIKGKPQAGASVTITIPVVEE